MNQLLSSSGTSIADYDHLVNQDRNCSSERQFDAWWDSVQTLAQYFHIVSKEEDDSVDVTEIIKKFYDVSLGLIDEDSEKKERLKQYFKIS